MNKKSVLTLLLLLLFSLGFSQEVSDYNSKLKRYTAKIDSLIGAEKKKMNSEFEILEKKFKNKEISESELNSQKTIISENTEKTINETIASFSDDFEKVSEEAVHNALFDKKNDSYDLAISSRTTLLDFNYRDFEGKDLNNPKTYYQKIAYIFSVSMLNYTNDKLFDFSSDKQLKNGYSGSILFRYENQLGKLESPFFYRLGLGWRFDITETKGNDSFYQDRNNLGLQDFALGKLKNSSLKADYIYVPLELQWVANPKYTEYKGDRYLDNSKKQLRFGVGVYGGYLVNNKILTNYKNEFGNKVYSRESIDNGFNKFLFGGKFSVGYAGFNLYVMKDFTPIFNNKANFENKSASQIGIDFYGIIF